MSIMSIMSIIDLEYDKKLFLKPLFDYFLKIESNDFFLNFKSFSPWDSLTFDL